MSLIIRSKRNCDHFFVQSSERLSPSGNEDAGLNQLYSYHFFYPFIYNRLRRHSINKKTLSSHQHAWHTACLSARQARVVSVSFSTPMCVIFLLQRWPMIIYYLMPHSGTPILHEAIYGILRFRKSAA